MNPVNTGIVEILSADEELAGQSHAFSGIFGVSLTNLENR
jgi:hypothetical protein